MYTYLLVYKGIQYLYKMNKILILLLSFENSGTCAKIVPDAKKPLCNSTRAF